MIKDKMPENVFFFEWATYPGEKLTVVAINDKLEYFQPQPVIIDGKMMERFNEKTIKDCRYIDGCIYLHRGRVKDSVMTDLIEKFQKAKKEVKDWKPRGRITVKDNRIII